MRAEGVPVAWTAFSESASWTGVWSSTQELAQARVDEFRRRWPNTGPYRVVPLYTHPAAASAESIRAEVIEECAKVCDGIQRVGPWHGPDAARNCASSIRALSARTPKES